MLNLTGSLPSLPSFLPPLFPPYPPRFLPSLPQKLTVRGFNNMDAVVAATMCETLYFGTDSRLLNQRVFPDTLGQAGSMKKCTSEMKRLGGDDCALIASGSSMIVYIPAIHVERLFDATKQSTCLVSVAPQAKGKVGFPVRTGTRSRNNIHFSCGGRGQLISVESFSRLLTLAKVPPQDVRVKLWGGSIQIDVVAADEAATGFCGVDIAKTAAAKGGRQQQRVALAIAEALRVQVDVASDAISNKATAHAIFTSAARRSPQKSSSNAQKKNTAAVHRLFSSCRAGASIAFSAKRDGKPSPPTKEEMDGGSATFVNESGAKYGHSCHGRSRSGVIPIQTTGYGASLVHFVRSELRT